MGKGREKGNHSSAKVTSERHSRSTPGGAPRCLSRVAPPHPCPSPFLSHHSAWDPALQRPLLDNLLAPTLVSRPYLRREQVLHASEDTLIPSEVDPKLDAPDSLLTPLLATPLPSPRQSANRHLGTPHPDSLYWAYLVILQTSPSPTWTQTRVDLLCSGFSLLPSLGFCGQFLLSESSLREGQVG